MTTLVTTRRPLQIFSMSNQAERRTSKRLAGTLHEHDATGTSGANHAVTAAADYERDDDFQFVRKSKRAKTEKATTEKQPEKAATPPPEPPKKSGRGRKAKARVVKDAIPKEEAVKETEAPVPATVTATEPTTTKTRKSTRRKPSVDASNEEPPLKFPKRATRKSARTLGEKVPDEPPPQTNGAVASQKPSTKRGRNGEAAPKRPVPNAPNWDDSPPPRAAPAKIALPMSDTPVINRNKEMRKKNNGGRRSSLGMRGRRASSLIDNGQSAIPHREVNAADFFKHIEASQLEPRRMKQLLTWCGERSLSEKPPHGTANANAILGGKICWELPDCVCVAETNCFVSSPRDSRPVTQGFWDAVRVFGLVQQGRGGRTQGACGAAAQSEKYRT